jgi:hypothetical protein
MDPATGRAPVSSRFWEPRRVSSPSFSPKTLLHSSDDSFRLPEATDVYHQHFAVPKKAIPGLIPHLSFQDQRFEHFFDTPEHDLLKEEIYLRFISKRSGSCWTLKVLTHENKTALRYDEFTGLDVVWKALAEHSKPHIRRLVEGKTSADVLDVFGNRIIALVTHRYAVETSLRNVKIWFDVAQFEREFYFFMGTFEGPKNDVEKELNQNLKLKQACCLCD